MKPTVIDLFCGCGGMSLGFIKAGWDVICGIDNNPYPLATYFSNLAVEGARWLGKKPSDHYIKKYLNGQFPPKILKYNKNKTVRVVICEDITKLDSFEILKMIGVKKVDCIIGGPPCPSFSMAGKRRIGDTRDFLIFEFARVCLELRPKWFLMENVPGLLSKKLPDGRKVFDVFQDMIKKTDWNEYYNLQNEIMYGIDNRVKV